MMPRIWLAVSDGESATDRLWQTTHRSCAATSWTVFSSTGAATARDGVQAPASSRRIASARARPLITTAP